MYSLAEATVVHHYNPFRDLRHFQAIPESVGHFVVLCYAAIV